MSDGTAELQKWYADRHAHIVDLVGDIAGRETFIVQGESLIRHCLETSKVDFDDGFQVLHAVFAVEKFLSNLHKRGCDFDIVFFRNLRNLCVPSGISSENGYKCQLTRTILIRHLTRYAAEAFQNGSRAVVHEFESIESEEFAAYLHRLPVHFILCHEGDGESESDSIQLRHMIYKFVSLGKNVGLLNSLEWKSSKLFAPLVGRSSIKLTPLHIEEAFHATHTAWGLPNDVETHFDSFEDSDLSMRERVCVVACRMLYNEATGNAQKEEAVEKQTLAFMLHLAILRNSTLLERQTLIEKKQSLSAADASFLRQVGEISQALLENEDSFSECSDDASWDIYDQLDGLLFSVASKVLEAEGAVFASAVETWRQLWEAFLSGRSSRVSLKATKTLPAGTCDEHSSSSGVQPAVLAFSHPILDPFLDGIDLKNAPEYKDRATDLVFEDLRHWHSTKPVVKRKRPEKLDFWARKRTQKHMADIVAYSASLTNANGKIINPETIVKGLPKAKKKKEEVVKNTQKTGQKPAQKPQKSKGPSKGGREDALRAAREVQEKKTLTKQSSSVSHWSKTYAEIEKDEDLVNRYLKTITFLLNRSPDDIQALGSETQLYLSHLLGQLWEKLRQDSTKGNGNGSYLIALIWNWLQQISALGASPAVVKAVGKLTTYLNMPDLPIVSGDQLQDLSFKLDYKPFKTAGKGINDHRALQIEYAGPYMERRFDSQPDSRVPFEPDAWQRKVLDSIDADRSLLVIAPTSAGKTFISFYAMKKVLEESDDGVLVYVAPTKALVNQIAAEIGARFSKSYHQYAGKSIWGLYTRDYRINNPTGCQILVTVPHILQTLLLTPTNANQPSAWSRRLKRIIFDEVHCIGNDEDGVVWEQLLLLAPCPIIALSATVGNPDSFRDWLSKAQKSKGQELDMIVHKARYSDLRKFVYHSDEVSEGVDFQGFRTVKRVPCPGLDEGEQICPNFSFVHPITALADNNNAALNTLTLEARDCLSLWTSLKKALTSSELQEIGLTAPSKLPEVITKQDILLWEENLKRGSRQLMETKPSLFQKVRQSLEPSKQQINNVKLGIEQSLNSLFSLACDLHAQNALPALVFHYDGTGCEEAVEFLLSKLDSAEKKWKETSTEWAHKLVQFESWKTSSSKAKGKKTLAKPAARNKDDASKGSKLDMMREESSYSEVSPWQSFDPDAPLAKFSFADSTKMQPSEFLDTVRRLETRVEPWLVLALKRGLGVHHSGMNRMYRQTVEILFRKGYLRLVVATGTLALGVNMPCKTVVFHRDSVFLTAQNYHQSSGRAGRRGFDLLGNVVFHDVPTDRVYEIMSARLPELKGQFSLSTTLILRLLALLDGTKNSEFSAGIARSLLSQTHLYLGGPESEMAVRHHLRFTIEYLRRQQLISAKGAPVNFSGLVGHLYFTENSVFAFHSLLKGGYFHQLCAEIDKHPKKVMMKMLLVLCHLFNRIPIRRTEELVKDAEKSSSLVFLPRLPQMAEDLLIEHNKETLSIFKDYVQSYINHNLTKKADRVLPFSSIAVGQEKPLLGLSAEKSTTIRSPFVALSGFTDEFSSIHELCQTVRDDVFLEESAIPYIAVWPHDSKVELNSYIYDFFINGSLTMLVKDNHIKRGDVWFFLQDFSRTLSTIVSSLTALISSEENLDEDEIEPQADADDLKPNVTPDDYKDGFEDEDSSSDSESDDEDSTADEWSGSNDGSEFVMPAWRKKGGDLVKVLKAFTLLRDEFDAKFRKTWA